MVLHFLFALEFYVSPLIFDAKKLRPPSLRLFFPEGATIYWDQKKSSINFQSIFKVLSVHWLLTSFDIKIKLLLLWDDIPTKF